MSRVTLSALLSDARNKIGDVVFTKWKGRNVVRTRVVPANPNSTAQQQQRTAFTICVESWQSLISAIKSAWNTYGSSQQISGFNAFMSANVADERTDDWKELTPPSTTVGRPGTLTAATGTNSGEIDLSWTLGDAASGDQLVVAYRKTEESELTISEPSGSTMGDLSYTLSGLDSGTEYACYICANNATNGYSQGREAAATAA